MLGLLGAGAQSVANVSNGDSLTKLAQEAKTMVVPEFVTALLKTAADARVAMVYLANQPAPPETLGQKTPYESISADADFILHLKIMFTGYRSASKESDYSPFALVRVLVIDRKTQERVVQKVAAIGWETKSKTALVALGSTEPKYSSVNALLSDSSAALAGLSKALTTVAEAIPAKLP